MNVTLLRLARRHKGVRSWIVPGFGNAAKLTPSRLTPDGWGPAFHWPDLDAQGHECRRGVDVSRHRKMARHYAKRLAIGRPS